MEVKIGEILFLGGDSPYKLSAPLQGLESPAIRVGDGLYAGRDGGFVSGHFYGHRTIVFKGFYIASSCDEFSDLRRILFGLLRIRYALPILIKMSEDEVYYTEGFVTNVKADVDSLKSGEYQITLLCPDPILYATENDEILWQEEPLAVDDVTPIANGGDIEIYPVITITGVFDGIEVANDSSEMTMQVDVTTENESDEVVIDMEKRIITLNGSVINEYRTPISRWWPLDIENNNIIVYAGNTESGESGSPDIDVTIKYKEGYVGI